MPTVELYLLGMPRIERDGKQRPVDTRKAIALLAYLAVTGERHSRDRLASLFWPEADHTRSRAALRRTLSTLNRALGGTALATDRQSAWLETESDVRVDIGEFLGRIAECDTHGHPSSAVCTRCLPPLEQAATLYHGDFLAGFGLRDSPELDDWQFFQAETLKRELSATLERLVEGHGARGELAEAIGFARRWLSLDPLHEPAHRRLMELYHRDGQGARINADLSLTRHHRGLDEQATQLAHKALDLAAEADDSRALAQAHNILGVLARNEGEMARSRVHLGAKSRAGGDLR